MKKGWYGDERVDLYLPECEENPETHLIVACLSNISSFESEIRLKRKKLCNCPMKEVKDSFNMTKSVYDCAHREILTLELSDKIFYVSFNNFYDCPQERIEQKMIVKTEL